MTKMTKHEYRLICERFCDENDINDAVSRLGAGEPLAYILGEWYFYGETFRLNRDCLIPRPETELLVDRLIEMLPPGGAFADLCTGSGCIALSALRRRPDACAYACDISEGALCAASENARALGVSGRIAFECADLLSGFTLPERNFDIIVSNPPYIKTDVIGTLEPGVRLEPHIALDGGSDGLVFYRTLMNLFKNSNAPLLLEIGYDQAEDIKKLFTGDVVTGDCVTCEIFKDYGGQDRVAVVKRHKSEVQV